MIISLTADAKSPVEQHIRRVPMEFPLGCGNQSGTDYGEEGIPYSLLIGPDGVVVWQGNSADLHEPQIEEQLARIERFPVPATLHAALEPVRADLTRRNYAAAIRTIQRVAGSEDGSQAAAGRELLEAMDAYVRGKIAEAGEHRTAGRLRSAHRILSGLDDSFKSLASGVEAQNALRELTRDPAFRAEQSAMRLLDQADAKTAEGKARDAVPMYEQILSRYADTETAGIARQRLGR